MPEEHRRLLLVEGRDDREVVYQICNYHSVDNKSLFEVKCKDGYESLRNDLSTRAHTDVDVIGAIVDADTDPEERWDSLCGALIEAGYRDLPTKPSQGGTIIPKSEILPSIGIWLMPNNRLGGMLEDFLTFLVKDGDVLLSMAESCIDSIPERERRFRETYRSKALIHTYLAWQDEPGTALGLAITKRYFNGDHELVRQFVEWLTRLFSDQR